MPNRRQFVHCSYAPGPGGYRPGAGGEVITAPTLLPPRLKWYATLTRAQYWWMSMHIVSTSALIYSRSRNPYNLEVLRPTPATVFVAV